VEGTEARADQHRIPKAAFYCVSDRAYFVGAVGLVNSLRLIGHREPIFVLDCGLTPAQRRLLAPQVTLVRSSSSEPPWLLKTVAPLTRPAEVMVLLDADMVVTRPLTPLIDEASRGRVVAFENPIYRFVPEWGELLKLGKARRQSYVGSGAVCVQRRLGTEILNLLADRQTLVDFAQTFWRQNVADYPFVYGDQDVLNAILSTRIAADRIVALDHRLAPTPPFSALKVIDEATLRCGYDDGLEPFLVHHLAVKPWLEPTHHGVYSRLLRRLLVGPGLAVRVPEDELPLRMRTGLLAYAERARVNVRELFRWHVREPISSRLGTRSRTLGATSGVDGGQDR
jgi:hypothetical protein